MDIGKSFICSISKKHLLKETKILPCNSLVCTKCAKVNFKKCPCCDRNHDMSYFSLKSDPDVDQLIKINCEDISKELNEKLKQKIVNLEGIIKYRK